MERFEYLQPIDKMERISRNELATRLDEIMALIDKNNVGYVISDEGKDDLVMCPANWFLCTFDDDFGCMINSALRYAIGRETYMPSTVMAYVRRNIHVMDSRTIYVMIEDIERELSDDELPFRADWEKFHDDLKLHYSAMIRKGEEQATSATE